MIEIEKDGFWKEGYAACNAGAGKHQCPYAGAHRSSWRAGWEARFYNEPEDDSGL
jgi:ribosome modulation factor